jgi:hypothetical protein
MLLYRGSWASEDSAPAIYHDENFLMENGMLCESPGGRVVQRFGVWTFATGREYVWDMDLGRKYLMEEENNKKERIEALADTGTKHLATNKNRNVMHSEERATLGGCTHPNRQVPNTLQDLSSSALCFSIASSQFTSTSYSMYLVHRVANGFDRHSVYAILAVSGGCKPAPEFYTGLASSHGVRITENLPSDFPFVKIAFAAPEIVAEQACVPLS